MNPLSIGVADGVEPVSRELFRATIAGEHAIDGALIGHG